MSEVMTSWVCAGVGMRWGEWYDRIYRGPTLFLFVY